MGELSKEQLWQKVRAAALKSGAVRKKYNGELGDRVTATGSLDTGPNMGDTGQITEVWNEVHKAEEEYIRALRQ